MAFTVTEKHTKRVVVEVPDSVRIDAAFHAADFVNGTSRRGPACSHLNGGGDCSVYVTEQGRVGIRCFGFNGILGKDGMMSVEFDPSDLVALARWIQDAEIIAHD